MPRSSGSNKTAAAPAGLWAAATAPDTTWRFAGWGAAGQPQRKSAGVRELIIAPVREHSRKPDEIYRRVEAFSDGPFLEIVCAPAMAGLDMCR